MEPLTLSALAASALTQAVKFLYDRAGAALDRRATAKQNVGNLDSEVLANPLEPLRINSTALTVDRVARLERARGELSAYVQDRPISPDDQDLLATLTRVREDLEAVYGQRFTFVGEQRPRARVSVRQDEDHVDGAVTGIAASGLSGTVDVSVEQRAGVVHRDGEVTGLRLDGTL